MSLAKQNVKEECVCMIEKDHTIIQCISRSHVCDLQNKNLNRFIECKHVDAKTAKVRRNTKENRKRQEDSRVISIWNLVCEIGLN